MKIALAAVLLLAGCATTSEIDPSFWYATGHMPKNDTERLISQACLATTSPSLFDLYRLCVEENGIVTKW